jgi:hypothetical protein
MDFYRASNSPSWERLWKALYVEDVLGLDAGHHCSAIPLLLAWLAVPFCMPPLILGEDTLKGNIANIRTE